MKNEITHFSADFHILEYLRDDGRDLPSNIADELGLTPEYVSNRLKALRDYGMVVNVGRGVHQITERGRVALDNQQLWARGGDALTEYRERVRETPKPDTD